MRTRKLVAAGAIAASVAGGAVGGALLFTPTLSGAQTTTTTEERPSTAAARPEKVDHLESAAEAIGLTVEQLRTALEGGKTIAQVAEDNGKDVDDVIAAMVADAQDELKARITALVNGEVPLGGRDHHGPGMHGGRIGLDAAATALGITEDELRTALESGKTIAQVAEDEGKDVDDVVAALVKAASDKLDAAVEAGKLTEAQAAERKADLEEQLTAFVNGERPAFGGRGFRGGPPTDAEGASYAA